MIAILEDTRFLTVEDLTPLIVDQEREMHRVRERIEHMERNTHPLMLSSVPEYLIARDYWERLTSVRDRMVALREEKKEVMRHARERCVSLLVDEMRHYQQ